MEEKKRRYDSKIYSLQLHYLQNEIENKTKSAFTQTIPKVIKRYNHEDLLKVTEYYKPCLAYVIKNNMTKILQTLITKQILANNEIYEAKEESESTEDIECFIDDMMKKDRVVLVSLWQVLAEEVVRFPTPNLIRIMEEVTEERKKLLENIETSIQSPALDSYIKDLHETHRLSMSESTRTLDSHPLPGDQHIRAMDCENRYTELVIIRQDTTTHKENENELVKIGRIHAEMVEKRIKEKFERIWTEQIFRMSPEGNIVVVSGVAGIGKTTMVQKIILDWTKGTHYQKFAFVFLFKFKDFNLLDNEKESEISLTTLIARHYKYFSDNSLREILQNPKSLLFILDGLDEYKHKLDFRQSQLCSDPDDKVSVYILVTSLISRTLLKGCSILITSRPASLEALDRERVDQFVKILGFFHEQRLMYFKKFFSNSDLAIEAFRYVEENAILYTMCFNPSYCWIICSVLKSHFMIPKEERGATPTTVTEVFVIFLLNILTNHRREAEDQRGILVKLGKMAYHGVNTRNFVFHEMQEMFTFGLHPVLCSSFLSGFLQRESTQEHTTYTFSHLIIQEFMAACSFYLDPSGSIEEMLVKLDSCKDGRFEILTRFMAGLARTSMIKKIEGILGEFEIKAIEQILEWMKQKGKQALLSGNKSEAVRVCQWLSETQNKELIRGIIGENLQMDFSEMTLSPLECAALGSVISCCGEIEELVLSDTHLTLESIRRLVLALSCCRKVQLKSCGLTSGCCSALSSMISAPYSRLISLWMSNNKVEDSGVDLLCEGLMSKNCKLEILGLWSCHLTSGCCSALSLVLSSPHSCLIYLGLSFNNLRDSGVKLLCEGLRSKNCKLNELGLRCNLITEHEKRNLQSLEEELKTVGQRVNIII